LKRGFPLRCEANAEAGTWGVCLETLGPREVISPPWSEDQVTSAQGWKMEEGRRRGRSRGGLTQPEFPEQQLRKGEKSSKGQEATWEEHCSLDCRDDNLEKGGQCYECCPV